MSTFTEITGCFQPGQAKVGPGPTPLGSTTEDKDDNYNWRQRIERSIFIAIKSAVIETKPYTRKEKNLKGTVA